jgi:hypothetical protein
LPYKKDLAPWLGGKFAIYLQFLGVFCFLIYAFPTVEKKYKKQKTQ